MNNLRCFIIICIFLNILLNQFKKISVRCDLIDKDDGSKSVIELIKKYGYPIEEHAVFTEDGYILSLYRLPNPNAKDSILLIHGLMGSSSDFILIGPRKALAYILFENGYDVWIFNCRGTVYSQNHTSLKSFGTTANEYWNFSLHEMGYYDVPATIDYILARTNRTQIVHYGHSQGTTIFFIMLAEKPQYNQKIKASISAAPAIFLCHTTNNIIQYLVQFLKREQVWDLLNQMGNFNFVSIIPQFLKNFLIINCNLNDMMRTECLTLLYELFDLTPSQVNPSMMSVLFGHYPHGCSKKQMLHFGQNVLGCHFRKYQEHFNIIPENYNLQNVDVPIYALIGQNDTIQDPRDSMYFRNNLKNGFKDTIVIKNWGHSDFAMAKDAPRLVFDKVLEILLLI